ncbi:small-subunit processome [Atractiella rhizophila]|nr:small-subunit processome [Atractiella rhizophila]
MREMAMPEFKGGDEDEGEDVVDESLSVPSTIPESNGAVKWSPLTNSNGTNMVTTSLMPRSKWIALLQLDVIRHRNKPKQPPKAPEQAPFFLPTVEGVEHKFDFSDVKDDGGKGKEKAFESRHLINFMDGIETELVRRIKAEPEDGDYADVFEYLRNLSPAGIDREIGGLTNTCHLTLFLRAVLRRLELHLDFEMLQSFLNVTLRSHGDVVMPTGSEVHDDDEIEVDEELEREELLRLLRRIGEVEREESHRLGTLLGFALGSLKFVKNEPLG